MSELIYGLGLLVPEQRPVGQFPHCMSAPGMRMLTKAEIEKITTDPRRTPARKQFGKEFIRSQGRFSSCAGYGGAKALEKARVLRGEPWVPLSGEGLYSQTSGGRDQGSMLDDNMKAMTKVGVPPESMVPHGTYQWNRVSQEAKDACYRFRAIEGEIFQIDEEDELASWLALGFPAVVALQFGSASNRLDKDGISGAVDGPGNHCEHCDDVYVLRGEYIFDTANSHDITYGDDGRSYTTWKRHYRETAQKHCFYGIRTTTDDPLNRRDA